MSKVTQVYYGFVIPKNKCVKKKKLVSLSSLTFEPLKERSVILDGSLLHEYRMCRRAAAGRVLTEISHQQMEPTEKFFL
jgi:hypothetical protein